MVVLGHISVSEAFTIYTRIEASAPIGGRGRGRALATTVTGGTGGCGCLGRVAGYVILENREESRPDVDLVYVANVDECCTGDRQLEIPTAET